MLLDKGSTFLGFRHMVAEQRSRHDQLHFLLHLGSLKHIPDFIHTLLTDGAVDIGDAAEKFVALADVFWSVRESEKGLSHVRPILVNLFDARIITIAEILFEQIRLSFDQLGCDQVGSQLHDEGDAAGAILATGYHELGSN